MKPGRKPLSPNGDSRTYASKLSPEDQILIGWLARKYSLKPSAIIRAAIRQAALTASGTGPDRSLTISDFDELKDVAIKELISEIESDFHGYQMTEIGKRLDKHGRYI